MAAHMMSRSTGASASAAGAAARTSIHNMPDSAFKLTQNELDQITEVFKTYEVDPHQANMHPRDLAVAMKKLGLNPTETEIQDLINEVEVDGLIYYQDFCKIIIRKMREEDEENFYQELFRTLVGPNPPPPGNAPALPYNVTRQRLSLEQFDMVMQSLPLEDSCLPSAQEIREMFAEADRDSNGRITYNEFRRMCVVPKLETIPDQPGSGYLPNGQHWMPTNGGGGGSGGAGGSGSGSHHHHHHHRGGGGGGGHRGGGGSGSGRPPSVV